MAVFKMFVVVSIFTIGYFNGVVNSFSSEIVNFNHLNNCNISEYFNSDNLKCYNCDSKKNLVPSADKFSCECNNKSVIAKWDKTGFPICILCPAGEVPTDDKKLCVPCLKTVNVTKTQTNKTLTTCVKCSPNEIRVDRDVNGTLLLTQKCVKCSANTRPSFDGTQCEMCPWNTSEKQQLCECPTATHELLHPDICVQQSAMSAWPDEPSSYSVEFPQLNKNVQSQVFKDNLRRYFYQCKMRVKTACQAVANMCVMSMYRDDHRGGPCTLFRDSKRIPTSSNEPLPWLMYGEGDAPIVLSRKKIPVQYSLDPYSEMSSLNLTAVRWSTNGTWLGISQIQSSWLQLCPESWISQDEALRFGSFYHISCTLKAQQLLQNTYDEFVELYLQYRDGTESLLYAIPVLNLNFRQGVRYPNKDYDMSQWQLTRRFFLVDKQSGIPATKQKSFMPSAVRYMRSCSLRVKIQEGGEGKIYPPLLIIEYGEVSDFDIAADTEVHITFTVEFYASNSITHTSDVWIGVLCGFAVVWSAMQTWSHTRRSGQTTIDLFTLVHLCLITCGHLANVFFGVVTAAAIHTFIYYKGQAVPQVFLPSNNLHSYIRMYIIVAFSLKIVEIVHLIWKQVTIDIFLIDWERPRATKESSSQPVSIWRTYFVANEWNEIQIRRKTSLLFQLLVVIFLLKECGIEHWSISDPDLHSKMLPEIKHRPSNGTLRFAVTVIVYLLVYTAQWLFMTAVYERYIKNCIQEFVDVCSMANISVFILSLQNFGYYVHGRSAHGFADTDMQTIMNQLQREEDDLVGYRGLLPQSDQQTFQMFIPNQLRMYYNKVMPSFNVTQRFPGTMSSAFRMKMAGTNNNSDIDRSIQAYHNMNKFLAAFLEHALKDLDYEVRDKMFVEALLDIEFSDTPGRGVLYIGAVLLTITILSKAYPADSHMLLRFHGLSAVSYQWIVLLSSKEVLTNPNCFVRLVYDYLRKEFDIPPENEFGLIDEDGSLIILHLQPPARSALELLKPRATYTVNIFENAADDATDEVTLQTMSGSSKQTIRSGSRQKSSSLTVKEKKKNVSSKTLTKTRNSVKS